MRELILDRDKSAQVDDAINISDTIYYAQIAADTDTTLTVPTGANKALFKFYDETWVGYDEVVTLPTNAAFANTIHMEGNPLSRDISGITTLHFRSPRQARVAVAFYA